MSIIDKAIEVIVERTLVCDLFTARDIAKNLADAGLLAPDLPEPNRLRDRPDEAGWFITDGTDTKLGSVWGNQSYGNIDLILEHNFTELTPTQARDIAHRLLAAADFADEEQNNA